MDPSEDDHIDLWDRELHHPNPHLKELARQLELPFENRIHGLPPLEQMPAPAKPHRGWWGWFARNLRSTP